MKADRNQQSVDIKVMRGGLCGTLGCSVSDKTSMLKFTDSDFQSLETFSLNWRWTDERWNKLPEDMLQQIKPFTQTKAKELWRIAGHYVLSDGPRVNLFECSPWIDASVDVPNAEQKVHAWLLSKFSGRDQEIIVSWDQSQAVSTRWGVFCDYWDDFCYPASDDVTVFPSSINWPCSISTVKDLSLAKVARSEQPNKSINQTRN